VHVGCRHDRREGGGTILDAIGNTPLVVVDGIWVKLEFLNPSGSIKARLAKYMIERAEREGLLRPGDTIVEASSGNTGNALSMVAAVKGYRMLVVMPSGMSGERLAISRAFGAQDAVVGGVGTGGTIVGVGQCFRERSPACRVVAVEPDESCTLLCGEVGRHLIEGIADGFVPGIFARHRHIIDEIVAVDSDAAISEMRRLAREFGPFAGPSSGAHLIAARQLQAHNPDLRHVVTFFCDEGEKYINDYFLGA
jgi:cysteine synthase